MKIAVSSTGTDLSATIDERFGRCRYFILLETDDISHEVIDNPNADLSTSAGIQSASLVANAGVEAVITGNCGPKAMQVFNETKIRIILGQHGVIRDVIEKFKKGDLDADKIFRITPISGQLGVYGWARSKKCRDILHRFVNRQASRSIDNASALLRKNPKQHYFLKKQIISLHFI